MAIEKLRDPDDETPEERAERLERRDLPNTWENNTPEQRYLADILHHASGHDRVLAIYRRRLEEAIESGNKWEANNRLSDYTCMLVDVAAGLTAAGLARARSLSQILGRYDENLLEESRQGDLDHILRGVFEESGAADRYSVKDA